MPLKNLKKPTAGSSNPSKTKWFPMTSATSQKIEKIKALRNLTRLLGKLGVPYCVRENPNYNLYERVNPSFPRPRPPWNSDKYTYGYGLKEAKDAVEAYLSRKAGTTTT